jgi:hypothetical protein
VGVCGKVLESSNRGVSLLGRLEGRTVPSLMKALGR